MTKAEFKQLIRECLMEVSLPPGFSSGDFKSVDDFLKTDINEADEPLLGAPVTDLPPDEMKAYMDRIAQRKLDKTDKFKYPYIHRSNIVDDNGNLINQEKLKALIKIRPEKLLKQNTKMQKSGGANFVFYDISLPALRGLIVDESNNEFKIVNTCPGAGACKVYCYAKKGGYVQWKASSLFQTRMVNFLLNDYTGFKSKLLSELNAADKTKTKKGIKVVLRWHDSGDFMSEKYLQMAFDIAKTTPNIIHYAYTKRVGMVSAADKPKNFVFNFSQGASAPEEGQITPEKKQSIVVPKQVFQAHMHKEEDGWKFNSPEDEKIVKDKLSLKYNIEQSSIITYKELIDIPYSQDINIEPKYNVIVVPGDGDVSAMRKDVLGTYLFIH